MASQHSDNNLHDDGMSMVDDPNTTSTLIATDQLPLSFLGQSSVETDINSSTDTAADAAAFDHAATNVNNHDVDDSDADENDTDIADHLQLQQWWVNERSSPDILPFQFELVENLLEMVNVQTTTLAEERAQWESDLERAEITADEQLRATISKRIAQQQPRHQYQAMELARVKYLVKSYLVARLVKIQRYARYLARMQPERAATLLALTETEFLRGFVDMLEQHYVASSLDGLDESLTGLDNETIIVPNLHRPVFMRPKIDVGSVVLMDDIVVDFPKGAVFIAQYRFAEELLLKDQVELL